MVRIVAPGCGWFRWALPLLNPSHSWPRSPVLAFAILSFPSLLSECKGSEKDGCLNWFLLLNYDNLSVKVLLSNVVMLVPAIRNSFV